MATTIRGSDNWDSALAKSVAIIADVKAYNVNGGTFTQDAFRIRDLNTEIDDPSDIVTLASNQFTLQAGTYLIEWSAPAFAVNQHYSRLWNDTDSATVAEGTAPFSSLSSGGWNASTGATIQTISGAKAFEIQHRCQTTKATIGFGLAVATNVLNSVFTTVKIHLIGV